jgi:hypothetical protein
MFDDCLCFLISLHEVQMKARLNLFNATEGAAAAVISMKAASGPSHLIVQVAMHSSQQCHFRHSGLSGIFSSAA